MCKLFIRILVILNLVLSVMVADAQNTNNQETNKGNRVPVKNSALFNLQEKQTLAISKARFSVVNIRAYNKNKIGVENIGSGFIVSHDGFVVTNSHVVLNFDFTDVGVMTGKGLVTFNGTLVKIDKKHDLALLKINENKKHFKPVSLSVTGNVSIGETVFVIGSPYGFSHTVTKGIVSKRKRTIAIDGMVYRDMIQTDASINQGNSGGPVINMNGNVVGVATAIFSKSGGSNGLGFAIDINMVKDFIKAETGLMGMLVKAPVEMEVVNLNAKIPHKFLGNCLDCHKIAFKTPITPGEVQPHPEMGVCTQCHEIVKNRPGKVLTVAATQGFIKDQLNKKIKIEKRKKNIDKETILTNAILLKYIFILICIVALTLFLIKKYSVRKK